MRNLAAVLVVMAAVVACASPVPSPLPTASPDRSPSGTPLPVTPAPSATPLAETVLCIPFVGPLSSALEGDPCPSAIAAVRAIVAPLTLPIARIVVEAGQFPCGGVWPGIASPAPVCFGAVLIPGTTMYGWVRFVRSSKVAAVWLHRPAPQLNASPAPSEVWTAMIAAFEIPPAGWVMP
jgi:hypothetical protein